MALRKIFTTYAVVKLEDLDKVDFSQVGETSADTVRKNVLDPPTQFLLKWDNEPTFITDGTIIPDALYNHKECIELLNTSTWSNSEPEFA